MLNKDVKRLEDEVVQLKKVLLTEENDNKAHQQDKEKLTVDINKLMEKLAKRDRKLEQRANENVSKNKE